MHDVVLYLEREEGPLSSFLFNPFDFNLCFLDSKEFRNINSETTIIIFIDNCIISIVNHSFFSDFMLYLCKYLHAFCFLEFALTSLLDVKGFRFLIFVDIAF